MTPVQDSSQPALAKIDSKNRLPLASQLREEDNIPRVLTIDFDGGMVLMSQSEFDRIEAKLSEYSLTNEDARRFRRTMKWYVSKVNPDAQKRIIVPERLLTLIGVNDERREVAMQWMDDRLEIWEKTRFEAYMSNESYELDPIVKAYREVAKQLTL